MSKISSTSIKQFRDDLRVLDLVANKPNVDRDKVRAQQADRIKRVVETGHKLKPEQIAAAKLNARQQALWEALSRDAIDQEAKAKLDAEKQTGSTASTQRSNFVNQQAQNDDGKAPGAASAGATVRGSAAAAHAKIDDEATLNQAPNFNVDPNLAAANPALNLGVSPGATAAAGGPGGIPPGPGVLPNSASGKGPFYPPDPNADPEQWWKDFSKAAFSSYSEDGGNLVIKELETSFKRLPKKVRDALPLELEKLKKAIIKKDVEGASADLPTLRNLFALFTGRTDHGFTKRQAASINKLFAERNLRHDVAEQTSKNMQTVDEFITSLGPDDHKIKSLWSEFSERIKKTASTSGILAEGNQIIAEKEAQKFAGGLTNENLRRFEEELVKMSKPNPLMPPKDQNKLKADMAPGYEVLEASKGFKLAQERYDRFSEGNYRAMVSLVRSNLPIEVVLAMFMALLSDRMNEKLKLKMEEVAVAEAVERYEKERMAREKESQEGSKAVRPLPRLPFTMKSSQLLMQELQSVLQQNTQAENALSGALRQLQDLVNSIIQKIR